MAQKFPAIAFKKIFNNPEIIQQSLLQGKTNRLFVDNPEFSFREHLESVSPMVEWIFPVSAIYSSKKQKFNIRAKINSPSHIKKFKLLINGRPVQLLDTSFYKSNCKNQCLEVNFELDTKLYSEEILFRGVTAQSEPKNIKIQFYVENKYTKYKSETYTILIDNEEDIATVKPNLHLLSIGISEYKDQFKNLQFAHKDAMDINAIFRDQQGKLFNQCNLYQYVNEDATRDNIISGLQKLKNGISPGDLTVIFVASHGINLNDTFYILPFDGETNDLTNSAVSWKHFTEILGNIPSKVLLLFDACYSGKLGSNIINQRFIETKNQALNEISSWGNNVILLASSQGNEYSQESKSWQHGAYTKALIEGLKQGEADKNKDGVILFHEIESYVINRVHVLTKGRQHPVSQKAVDDTYLKIRLLN